MADRERQRLTNAEESAWRRLVAALDRIPPAAAGEPGAGPDDWTVRDVLYHLASWSDESARHLAAVREGRFAPRSIDTDELNAEILREGRALGLDDARVRLERARSRALAEWAAVPELSAPAVEWFAESGPEHIEEHIEALEAFAERVGGGDRPGAPARREGMLAAEAQAWDELGAVVASIPPDALGSAPVTPDGWTVKDTMWHVARWWEDFVDDVAGFDDPAPDPDRDSTLDVDAVNRSWFEESRALPLDRVRDRWTSARAGAVAVFRSMADPSPAAEAAFVECGTTHYEKHLIDVRPLASRDARGMGLDAP
jgi:hypothetical protein